MIMQYANCGTLSDYLHGEKNKFETLTWEDKYHLALGIGQGLHHLHDKGIIHQDLKSKNVLVNGGKALISDFGLSKDMVQVKDNESHVLADGHFVYIAP